MRNNLQYLTTGSGCAYLDDTTLESCVLRVVDCDKTNGTLLLTDCDKLWNCNRCQTDPQFWMAWVDGMKFMLQTQFVNTSQVDPETPTAGWGDYIKAELLDVNFNVIESNYQNIASRWMVGWDGDTSYQIIEIDTSLTAFNSLECFIIRISGLDSFGATYKTLCTHHFRRLQECEEAILIEGVYGLSDCFDNFYSLPDEGAWYGSERFAYSNALYYKASVKDYRDSFEKEIVNNRVVSVTQISSTRLVFHDFLPPFASRIITRQMLPAPVVAVNGISYTIDSFTVDNQVDGRNYFFYTVDLEQKCVNDLRCVPAGEFREPPILPETPDTCVECVEVSCFG